MSDDLVRKVSVTVEVTTMYTGTYEIDLPDYLDWLGEDSDDSPAKVAEYLRSGIDAPEVISAVYDSARFDGTEEVYDSSIDSVQFIRDDVTKGDD